MTITHLHSPKSGKSPTYVSWEAMHARCRIPSAGNYARYGGVGIEICERWFSFENFLADMGLRPEGKTLDRVNKNGGYYKENCRWATPLEQAHHRQYKNTLVGVSFERARGTWRATGERNRKRTVLYNGPDFFEAVCARKSWEAEIWREEMEL